MVTRSDSDGIARPRNSDFLSDIRMTITLYKHMSTRLSKVRAPTHGGRARTGWRSTSRTNLEGSHPIVFRVVFDLGEMQGLQHGRNVHAESPAKTLLQSIPPTDGILRGSTPRLNGPVRGRLLLVRASQGHPVSARLEHLVQVVDASEVVPELRAPDLTTSAGGSRASFHGTPEIPMSHSASSSATDVRACLHWTCLCPPF